jgi:hypothetical protein
LGRASGMMIMQKGESSRYVMGGKWESNLDRNLLGLRG